MGDGKRYIPHGSFLECDKGAIPTQLQVTHHNNTAIYGEPLASEADSYQTKTFYHLEFVRLQEAHVKLNPYIGTNAMKTQRLMATN